MLTGIAVRAATPRTFSHDVSVPIRSRTRSKSAESRRESPIPTTASSVGRWVLPGRNPTK